MRRAVLILLLLAACSGSGGESAKTVCTDLQTLVVAGKKLPSAQADWQPILDRALKVDELKGAAGNIQRNLRDGDSRDSLVASMEGLFTRCREDAGVDLSP